MFLYVIPDSPTGRSICSGLSAACSEDGGDADLEHHETFQLDREGCPYFELLVNVRLVEGQDPHIALLVGQSDNSVYAALARKVGRGSGQRRLVRFELVSDAGLTLREVVEELPQRLQQYFPPDLEEGRRLGTTTEESVIGRLLSISEGFANVLSEWTQAHQQVRVEFSSRGLQSLYNHERDATALALQLSGFAPTEFMPSDRTETGSQSFSAQFGQSLHLREDDILDIDFHVFDGMQGQYESLRRITFENAGLRLDVIYANRRVLEEASGADLVYFNRVYQSWVFLQYKAMEDEPGGAVFRLPSPDLNESIGRMQALRPRLHLDAQPQAPLEYRLNNDPFYLKFCPRLYHETRAAAVSNGIYLPIDRFLLLAESDELIGPKGGRKLTHDNSRPYLTTTDFTRLLSQGWIGSRGDGSEFLEQLVEICHQGRKSVVAAFLAQTDGGDT